ncbi:uncharacterized protein ZBAI_04120 [Zygosaccharomyces bailii ISA1307]|nr:uncharacterized protein ZBAI_04120 [Zygosaccharomyces bailii ISA1307]
MESSDPGTSLAKFTKLQPKNPIDEELAMSKVHISKNWKLPPRLKPGRRPQVKVKPQEDEESETPEEQSKKKKQNRDAQRAYRERRANRLQELETTVATLQSVVKSWKCKYKDLEVQFQNAQAENSNLKQQMEDIKSSVCQLCFKEPCVCNKNSATLFQDPFLQAMVKNFKPMKAVNLKRRKVGSPKSPESSMPPQLDSVSSGSCGFCSDSTACVCKDMQTSTVTLGNCSSKSSATCENCADINKSCLATKSPEIKARPSQGKWEPGSCAHCKMDPASSAFCKSVCNPATIMTTIESQGSEDCSCQNTEPGTCTKCQEDPQRKEFCEAIFLNKLQPSTVENKSELIPVSDAYQKIRNYMQSEGKSEDSRPLLLPLRQIVSGLRIHGREVESKSVDDALRDMDKNALQ